MPVRPERVTLTNTSVDVLNAIRNSASQDYRDHVPIATPDSEVIRQIGAIIMDYPQLQNEFLNALVNRISRVLVSSRMWDNPWAMFKLGKLEFGEAVEDVFVDLARVQQYDPEWAETHVEAREIPDIKSAFYIMNYEKFYKVTIQEYDIKRAFLTINGVTDLISKIIESMFTAASYDEFQVMKYLLARRLLNGQIPVVPLTDATDMKELATKAKQVSNDMTFLSTKFNIAGVHNFAPKSEQYLIMNSGADASMDVEVLATAFNMSKAEFMGHRILVDGFGTLDDDRLAMLFDGQANYVAITSAEKTALNAIPAVLVDESFWKVIDFYDTTNSRYNEEGLYRNHWYHVGKSFATSPFANCTAFVPGTPAVTTVTVTPTTASIGVGDTVQLSAVVNVSNFGSKAVVWTTADATKATVNSAGIVTGVGAGQVVITGTSVEDSSKKATATITVTA